MKITVTHPDTGKVIKPGHYHIKVDSSGKLYVFIMNELSDIIEMNVSYSSESGETLYNGVLQ